MADGVDERTTRKDDQKEPESSLNDRLFTELNDRFISAAQLRLLEAGASPQERERALIAVMVEAFDLVASMAVRMVHTDEEADQCRAAISEAAVAFMTNLRTNPELQGVRPDFFPDLRLSLSARVHYWGAEALRVARDRSDRPAAVTDSLPSRPDHSAYAKWLNDAMTTHQITPNRLATVGDNLSRATVRRAMTGAVIRKASQVKLEKAIAREAPSAPPPPAY
jgi:hypothetical protein